MRDALAVAYDHVIHTLQRTAYRRKRLYDTKAVNRKFPVGSCVLRYYPPAAQKKLGSPWVGPQQVVCQATGHTVGIQKGPDTPIIFFHVDDLKLCPTPENACWTPGPSSAKSLCASTVAFRPGCIVTNSESTHSVSVSTCDNTSDAPTHSASRCKLDDPNDLKDHILSPFFVRKLYYEGCQFHSIAHLMCFRYAVLHGLRLFGTSVRKWTRHLTEFPTGRFQTPGWQTACHAVLAEIYSLSDKAVSTALIDTGPMPFCLQCPAPWGGLYDATIDTSRWDMINDQPPSFFFHVDDLKLCPTPENACWTPGPSSAKSLCASTVAFRPGCIVTNSESTHSVSVSTWDMINDVLIDTCVQLSAGTLESAEWLVPESTRGGLRNARRWLAAALMWLHIAGAHMYSLLGTVCRTPLYDILLSIPVIDLLLISDYHRMWLLSTYTYRKPLRTYDLTTQLFQKA